MANVLPLQRLAALARAVGAVGMLLYPVAMYFALTGKGPRFAALILLAVLLPSVLARLREQGSGALRSLALIPALVLVMLAASAALGEAGYALAVPSAVSGILFLAFGATLARGTPMIERFARLQDPDLTPDEVAWCRLWTGIWAGFLIANAIVAGLLAQAGSVSAWAIYSGGIAYGLMGLLFATEWTIRKLRFGRIGSSLPERALLRALGRRSPRASER